jgi:glycosyltransferase involved in cell wall biosynthesis
LSKEKLNIVALTRNIGFCYYYRILWPLRELEKRGLINVLGIDTTHENFIKDPGPFMADSLEWGDIFIYQYTNPSDILTRYADLCMLEKLPKLFIAEFDDDFTRVHPTNNYYRHAGIDNVKAGGEWVWKDNDICDHLKEFVDSTEEEIKAATFSIKRNKSRMMKMLRACIYSDAITTTTKELGETFEKFNQNVVVLPNYLDLSEMPEGKKKPRDHVLIGWQGGDSHYADIRIIMPALKKIKQKYGDKVQFQFMGAAFHNMYKELKAEHIPWAKPEEFFSKFSENLFDIGLVPIVDPEINKFNKSKSNIKWLEYSHYGIPSIVSNYKPYKQHIINGKTGLLCNTVQDWYENLCKLIDDPFFRMKMGSEAKKVVDKNFVIQNYAHRWYDFYSSAFKKKVEYLASL